MKLPRYNPFFHEEPVEIDVKHPKVERDFNYVLIALIVLAFGVWGAVLWLADRVLSGGW